MDDLPQLRNDAKDFALKAIDLENKENYEESIRMYNKSINTLKRILDRDTNTYNISTYKTRISEYEDRVDYLTKLIKSETKKKMNVEGGR